MKYCEKCKKQFEIEEDICPICGETIEDVPNGENDTINEYEAAEIISTMMVTGIL